MMTTVLWALAILFYGIGDYLTTILAVQHESIQEAMPITRQLLGPNPSPFEFALLKIIILGGLYLGYASLSDNQYPWIIPLSIAILGAFAVSKNSYEYIQARKVDLV